MQKRKLIDGYPFVSYTKETLTADEMKIKSESYYQWMDKRRTVRDFSDKPVPKEVIENIILTASTAPSGAHKQPWIFCIVSDPEIKKKIRIEAEKEEYESYHGRMPADWLEDLKPLQTNWYKEFIEIAPYIIIVFKKSYEIDKNARPEDSRQNDSIGLAVGRGNKRNVYYATESCGIACGFLLAAIHHAGLVALTHTPSPMNFLSKILNRPENEKPFLVIPVGYPAEVCWVPELKRKELKEVSVWYE